VKELKNERIGRHLCSSACKYSPDTYSLRVEFLLVFVVDGLLDDLLGDPVKS
jgi:hypothetical protein